MGKKEKSENQEKLDAFETYYSMGPDRTLGALAVAIGRNISTVNKWSAEFGWSLRIKKRDETIVKSTERAFTKIHETKAMNNLLKTMDIIEQCVGVFSDSLLKGDVDVSTIKDIEKLAELQIKFYNIVKPVENKSEETIEDARESAKEFRDRLLGLDSEEDDDDE